MELCSRGQNESVYLSSYSKHGELVAYFIAWNQMLQATTGSALCGCAVKSNLVFVLNGISSNATKDMQSLKMFNDNPDAVSMGLVLMMYVLGSGLRPYLTKCINTLFTLLTVGCLIFTSAVGLFYVSTDNWSKNSFLSKGTDGMLTGAAICLCIFDYPTLNYTTGSCRWFNSKHVASVKAHPSVAFALTILIGVLGFGALSSISNVVIPSENVVSYAFLANSFAHAGNTWMPYFTVISVVLFGGCVGITYSYFALSHCSLLVQDGLLYQHLLGVCNIRGHPVLATIILGSFSGLFALFFAATQLAMLLSLTIAIAYLIICVCTLYGRYQNIDREETVLLKRCISKNNSQEHNKNTQRSLKSGMTALNTGFQEERSSYSDEDKPSDYYPSENDSVTSSDTDIDAIVEEYKEQIQVAAVIKSKSRDHDDTTEQPTKFSSRIALAAIFLFILWNLLLSGSLVYAHTSLKDGGVAMIILVSIAIMLILCTTWVILKQPQDEWSNAHTQYLVPWFPWVPVLALIINIHLILRIPVSTFIPYSVACGVGLVVYLSYGIRRSREALLLKYPDEELVLLPPVTEHIIQNRIVPNHRKNQNAKSRLEQLDTVLIE